MVDDRCISSEIVLKWKSGALLVMVKSTLSQVIVWCRQAPNHYLGLDIDQRSHMASLGRSELITFCAMPWHRQVKGDRKRQMINVGKLRNLIQGRKYSSIWSDNFGLFSIRALWSQLERKIIFYQRWSFVSVSVSISPSGGQWVNHFGLVTPICVNELARCRHR